MQAQEQLRAGEHLSMQHEQAAAANLHSVRQSAWGPQASRVEAAPPSDALKAFDQCSQFCIGFGDGVANFSGETAQAAGEAISHPVETVQGAVDGAGKAIKSTGEAVTGTTSYLSDKVAHGDLNGMAADAVHNGQAIGAGIAGSIDHFNHLSAKEKGYIFGHDVAPTVVATVLAPELIPEGAALGTVGKIMSAVQTINKEEGVLGKVAVTFAKTQEKMQAMSAKLAEMSEKMHALAHGDKDVVRAAESMGSRIRDGKIVCNVPVSERFARDVRAAHETLTAGEASALRTVDGHMPKLVHNMAEELGKKHAFALGTWKQGENTIRIAEFTGFEGDLLANDDIRHTLVHEIGHLVNDKLGGWKGPISEGDEFLACFDKDLGSGRAASMEAANTLKQLYPNRNDRLHEVFADMFAHASDEALGLKSNSAYANQLKDGFPNCLDFVRRLKKDMQL